MSRMSDSYTQSPPDTQNSMVKAEDQVLYLYDGQNIELRSS